MTCSTEHHAAHDSGTRSMHAVNLVVIHSTEGDTAAGAASWFANEQSAGSTHLVVDDHECYRTLPDDQVPWGAIGANTQGLHVEQAGHAAWSHDEWMRHEATIDHCALHVARWCLLYDIEPRWLSPAEVKAHKSGITSHLNVTLAFGLDSHRDPGPPDGKHYPYGQFMARVHAHFQELRDRRHHAA